MNLIKEKKNYIESSMNISEMYSKIKEFLEKLIILILFSNVELYESHLLHFKITK